MIAASFSLFDFIPFARTRRDQGKIKPPEVALNRSSSGVIEPEQKDNASDWRMSESFFWGLPPFI
jgi:hypothetical protein